jgi:hypothetical protein
MAPQRRQRLAGLGIPNNRDSVVRSSDDLGTVGAERRGRDGFSVALELHEDGACIGVPNSRGLVGRSGDDPDAVGAERSTGYGAAMPAEGHALAKPKQSRFQRIDGLPRLRPTRVAYPRPAGQREPNGIDGSASIQSEPRVRRQRNRLVS